MRFSFVLFDRIRNEILWLKQALIKPTGKQLGKRLALSLTASLDEKVLAVALLPPFRKHARRSASGSFFVNITYVRIMKVIDLIPVEIRTFRSEPILIGEVLPERLKEKFCWIFAAGFSEYLTKTNAVFGDIAVSDPRGELGCSWLTNSSTGSDRACDHVLIRLHLYNAL